MFEAHRAPEDDTSNTLPSRIILGVALFSAILYGFLAFQGDLRDSLATYYTAHLALAAGMFWVWRIHARSGVGFRAILLAALAFRLLAAFGGPALSDDVYRYVWDGRVQLERFHPYAHAPDDPALEALRDGDWSRINHPEVRTIYPHGAQLLFFVVALFGGGVIHFQFLAGLADFGVVCVLSQLLERYGLPRHRVVLYAWNPLAVLETAGSGHLEPWGVLATLLAALWIIERRPTLSTMALGFAIQLKLLPLILVPSYFRRYWHFRYWILCAAVVAVLALPYALTGEAVPPGASDYAERWEHNAPIYATIEGALVAVDVGPKLKSVVAAAQETLPESALPWSFLYRHVWPRDVARLLCGALWLSWWLFVQFRSRLDLPEEQLWLIGGLLLLSPTLHPWYLLWLLPLAAAYGAWGFLTLGLTIPLAYWGGTEGGALPPAVLCAEFLPPLLVAISVAQYRKRKERPEE